MVERRKKKVPWSNTANKKCRSCQSQQSQQIRRLGDAGFLADVLTAVGESMQQKIKNQNKRDSGNERMEGKKVEVVPYLHGVSHNLKKVAQRHGVTAVFSAPCKLSGLCSRIAMASEGRKPKSCTVKHANKFVACSTRVVYKLPLSCGRVYTGQTGRCVNDRAREHNNSLRNLSDQNNLPRHCRSCKDCVPAFNNVSHRKRKKQGGEGNPGGLPY